MIFNYLEIILSNINLNADFVEARDWFEKQIGDFIE